MTTSGAKKKRVSKKLKVSWRKHVNVNDVEEYLEEKRLEERLGPSLSVLPNEDIFVLDTKPSEHLLLSKKTRKLRANRPLKCFSALQPHSKVPDPIAKRNHVRTKEQRKNDLIKKKELKNAVKGILKHKEIQSLADRRIHEIRKDANPKMGEFTKDIWAEEKQYEIQKDEWVDKVAKKHNLRGIGIPLKTTSKSVHEKKSGIATVEPPHPGMSYNPSFEDHQNLLRIVAEKETKLIKENEHLARVTTGMFRKVTEHQRDTAWIIEMSESLPSKGESNVEENEASDNEYKGVNPPVKNKKKTTQQRRKQREQLDLQNMRKQVKMEKKKIGDIHRLKVLQKQITKTEDKHKTLQEKRKKLKELKKDDPKILSSLKYEDPDLEFNMGEDISGNLKNLRKEGSLLADRYKSMQKRNILHPSKKRVHKKPKVKKYVKPGYKGDWEKTVAR